uniref:VTT domain-containing protein n=1 Tax=Candidatus Electrothrix sp. TaxID=2170559 RepID=UPI00405757BF
MVISDTLFAFFGYKFTKTLRKIFMSKKKSKDEEKVNARFRKYGNIAMFVGAATPLPFTLMVYTGGALKLPRRSFLIAIFFGRALKYSLLAIPIRLFEFDLVAYGKELYADFVAGNYNVMHFIILGIVAGLIIWLSTSIFKNVKKSKLLKSN